MNIIEHPSPNHSSREGVRVDTIIIHHTATPATPRGDAIALAALCSTMPGRRVSAHYFIGHDGRVYRLVPEDRCAWHAGKSQLPWEHAKAWHHPDSSVNHRSIGVEIGNPGDGVTPFTEAQYRALAWLVPGVVRRLTADGGLVRCRELAPPLPGAFCVNVLGHRDVAPGRKTDPANNFDWGQVRAVLAGGAG